MPDTKELTWGDAATPASNTDESFGPASSGKQAATRSWDAYRNWMSRAPAPTAKARPVTDPSVYTWKGYRNWSDKVKRNWSDRSDGE